MEEVVKGVWLESGGERVSEIGLRSNAMAVSFFMVLHIWPHEILKPLTKLVLENRYLEYPTAVIDCGSRYNQGLNGATSPTYLICICLGGLLLNT